ncbi:Imelysin [Alteromonadaceae bacterium Bs31]|nr:Imelysin [Alteromonadaceae bacterium Bs31]
MEKHMRFIAAALAMLGLLACESKDKPKDSVPPAPTEEEQVKTVSTEQETALLWEFGDKVTTNFEQSSQALLNAIKAFLDEPTAETLGSARTNWNNAHASYQHLFLINQFSRVEPSLFGAMARAQFALAAHPIQPGYLDYFDVYPYSGLVHDMSVELNEELLRQQHGLTDAADVVLGLYAIEFMLFGESGARPLSDYQAVLELSQADKEKGFVDTTETPNNRRRLLLQRQAELLVEDAKQASQDWRAIREQWQQLSYNVQRRTVHKAFEQGLTQVLLQTASASESEGPAHSRSAQDLSVAIRSLEAAHYWLPQYLREEQLKLLQEAAEALELANKAEDEKTVWRQTYKDLKMAMDLTRGI